MADQNKLRDPWLVAVWPGMGSVALLAGSYLLQQLRARLVAELDAQQFFEVQSVDVKRGIASAAQLPRSMFFEWRDPRGRRDLLIFIGEAQPATGGWALCRQVLDYATQRGVKRVITFAAMATQLHPGSPPRVFGAATSPVVLNSVKGLSVEILEDGQIGGLNGAFLAAAVEYGMQGMCLLGELPFFAVGVPNPRAAQVVLEQFGALMGIELDMAELSHQAELVDENLHTLMEKMNQSPGEALNAADAEDEPDGDSSASTPAAGAEDGASAAAPKPSAPALDARTKRRIEAMFDAARRDRARAMDLKQELDRLSAFKQYEDRFLDLFRKGE